MRSSGDVLPRAPRGRANVGGNDSARCQAVVVAPGGPACATRHHRRVHVRGGARARRRRTGHSGTRPGTAVDAALPCLKKARLRGDAVKPAAPFRPGATGRRRSTSARTGRSGCSTGRSTGCSCGGPAIRGGRARGSAAAAACGRRLRARARRDDVRAPPTHRRPDPADVEEPPVRAHGERARALDRAAAAGIIRPIESMSAVVAAFEAVGTTHPVRMNREQGGAPWTDCSRACASYGTRCKTIARTRSRTARAS
jgi:hypothetical protein